MYVQRPEHTRPSYDNPSAGWNNYNETQLNLAYPASSPNFNLTNTIIVDFQSQYEHAKYPSAHSIDRSRRV